MGRLNQSVDIEQFPCLHGLKLCPSSASVIFAFLMFNCEPPLVLSSSISLGSPFKLLFFLPASPYRKIMECIFQPFPLLVHLRLIHLLVLYVLHIDWTGR